MNIRDCKKLKPGAMVTEAYAHEVNNTVGMVLSKEYVEEEHYANVLGGKKQKRYDIWVQWLRAPKYRKRRGNPDKLQCWEVKLIENVE